MPPIGRTGTSKKGKGNGKGAVKSKSILSFFSAPVAARSSSQQQVRAPAPSSGSISSTSLVGGKSEASDPEDLVDLTDGGGCRSSYSNDTSTPLSSAGGAISPGPPQHEIKRDCLDTVGGGRAAGAGTATNRFNSGSGSSSKIGPSFGGSVSTAVGHGAKYDNTGFVRASSLIHVPRTNYPTAASSDKSTTTAPPTTTPTTTASTSRAPVTVARRAPPAMSWPSTSTPNSTPTSSWGSLGRRQQPLSSSNRNKPIALPIHVVGLQFRQDRANDAWSPPPATGSTSRLLPAYGQHDNSDIGSNRTLELEREPYNSHDPNAVKVLLPSAVEAPSPPRSPEPSGPARFLGYVPGRIAVFLAPILDAPPGTVARVTLKTVEDEEAAAGHVSSGSPRNTLPALLEVQPLGGAGKEPFSGLMAKLREAAKKEDKRQQKRRNEAKAHQERLRSKQKTLLLDFGRSSTGDASSQGGSGGGSSLSASRSAQGGAMLESMPWEVLWQVFCSPGISSRELFGPIRSVCGNWMRAVDAMPCATARRDVAKVCAGESVAARQQEKGGVREECRRGNQGRGTDEGSASSRPFGEADGGISDGVVLAASGRALHGDNRKGDDNGAGGDGGDGGGGGKDRNGERCWWDVVRARLVRGGGFTECAAKDVLDRLEWAAEHEEDEAEGDDLDGGGGAEQEAGGAAASAEVAIIVDDGASEEGNREAGRGGGDGIPCGGGRRRRMLRHLQATRALCDEWGLLVGATSATAAAAASVATPCFSPRSASSGGGGGGWSGWEAFGLAVVTSASRDRLPLCCWAVRPLMGGDANNTDDGISSVIEGRRRSPSCPGLPRGEVIELLCLMLCALRSAEGGGARARGTVRLEADLLVCARVLENWDVRFEWFALTCFPRSRQDRFRKAGQPGGGGSNSRSGGGGGASGLIANLTAEQRSIVLADVKAGEVLTVLAFAGTGKTTCLRAYAQARPHLNILYLTFNVSVREEAEKTFPPHVTCKGVHQLAFRFVGRRFQSKLTQDLRESDVQAFLKDRLGKEEKISLATAARVLSSLNAFFSSDSAALSASHVQAPPPEVLFQHQQQQQEEQQEQFDGGGGGEEKVNDGAEDSESDEEEDDDDAGRGGDRGGRGGAGAAGNRPSSTAISSSSSPSSAGAGAAGVVGAVSGEAPPKRKRSRRAAAPVEDATLLEWVTMAWAEMQSTTGPAGLKEGARGWGEAAAAPPATLGMTHAGYLKLFQLSRPCLGRTYDVIMLDEAQDSNPCIANIVLRETASARILVGDSHQAIYGFIGAEDHLRRVEGGKVRHLTQVFRFDQSIAHVANSLVGPLKGETRPLLGHAGKQGKVVLADGTGLDVWHEQGCIVKRPMAFLARTVAALVHAASCARSRGEKVAWVGGVQAYNLDAIEDMCLMAIGRSEEVKHPLLKKLKTTKRLIRFIQESGDRQWASRLRMLDGKDANDLLAELRELQRREVHPREADTILSTVHKAKGLEFDTVVLADDFIELDDIPWTKDVERPRPIWGAREIEEVNILYVAVTRAKRRLVANSSLRAFLDETGAWNSVCLRGVAVAPALPRTSADGTDSNNCALCGRRADAGGGGCRLERLSRAKAGASAEQGLQAAGGRVFSSAGNGSGAPGGLLYAESGSLHPLCCWCVEGWGHVEGDSAAAAHAVVGGAVGVDGDGQMVAALPLRGGSRLPSSFPYAKPLMRGLRLPLRESLDGPSG